MVDKKDSQITEVVELYSISTNDIFSNSNYKRFNKHG